MKAALLLLLAACNRGEDGPPLDRQWAKIVELSRPRVAASDPTLLAQAIDSIDPRRDQVRVALDTARRSGQPPELAPEDTSAVEALVSWSADRGGLPSRTCAEMTEGGRRGLAAVTLAELALASAPPDGRQARAEAVLYLGHRFRDEGVNMLDVTVGCQIADKAIQWATEEQVAPTPRWSELAPPSTADLLSRTLAAEAQCMVELARQEGDVRLASAELDALRRFYLSALSAIERGGSDDAIAARLAALTDEAHADRGHPTLKVLVPALGRHAERLLEQRRRYHAFLRGIR